MIPKIGITVGDPFGIGPEIVSKFLSAFDFSRANVRVYASRKNFQGDVVTKAEFVELAELEFPKNASDRQGRAAFCLRALDAASRDALGNKIDSLVTGPIDKSVVRTVDPTFTGHTEYLAKLAGAEKTVMMLDNSEIRVVLLTNHIPLRDVAREVTAESMERTIAITAKSMARFGIGKPVFAVTAVNPHAGEIVERSEEETVMLPLIEKLRKQGLAIEGPFPADSFFPKARNGRWDAIFCPYHDQGLVAVKYPGIDKVVNITLGLPYVRVSPGHGVAYDIVGKGQAKIESFTRAVEVAITRRLKHESN